jgi:drug/metabolite transporter (DMT)-like permease
MLITWAILYIPLALASIIFNLFPFWTSILAHCVRGDAIFKLEIVAMILCFLCVVGITTINPSDDENCEDLENLDVDCEESLIYSNGRTIAGVIIVFVGSWFIAAQNISNRLL